MASSKEAVARAIEDLATVRQALDSVDPASQAIRGRIVTSTHLTVQVVAFALAMAMLAGELLTGNWIARNLSLVLVSREIRVSTIALVAQILVVLVGALYFAVLRASRASQRDFGTFVTRNFAYLKNLSFLSDLLVKFAILALVVHLAAPQWIAPLLFLFIGDYLFQGRLFQLPTRSALILGVLCIAAAVAQAWLGSSLVSWPLAGFSLVCALSIVHTIRVRRAEAAREKEV